ncbi:MAG: methylated-DNA--[protein]-cysteine S-methyltransferase, partial [Gaiellaceae bacterium]
YEADGWGVGELVVDDDRVVWHELPQPRALDPRPEGTSPAGTRPAGTRPAGTGTCKDPSRTPTHPGHGAGVSRKASRGGRGFPAEVIRLLQAYFAGAPAALEQVPVDLEYDTDFLGRCADALRAVPRGEVVTYGELAALAGAPGAARAAGSFCARNRLGLFVPCHRVVAAGALGSYGSLGLAYKRRLLELEGWSVDAL